MKVNVSVNVSFYLLSICIIVLLVSFLPVFGGGPLILFQPGTPFRYDTSSPVVYNLDLGDLGPLTNEQADLLATGSFVEWEAVATATITFSEGTDLSEDVVLANADMFLGSPGVGDGLSPVVYDTDGSIIADFFGAPPGVLGIAGPTTAIPGTEIITESFSIFKGTGIDPADLSNTPPGAVFQGVFTHEHGHFINLAHTVVNGQAIFFGDRSLPDGTDLVVAGVGVEHTETMYPFLSVSPPVTTGEFQATPDPDDIAILSTIYPDLSFFSSTGTITGTVLDIDGVTGLTGVQVIARNTADLAADAVSAISGDFSQGAGPLGLNDGSFTINGLTPGANYLLYIIDTIAGGFSTPVFVSPGGTAEPSLGPLPGPEEFYNGLNESTDPFVDDPAEFSTILVAAGSPVTADIIINSPVEPRPADFAICYATTGKTDGGNLISIDPITGTGTLIGSTGLDGVPGLAINSSGFIFATDSESGVLYKIDAPTGIAVFVANTSLTFLDALAFNGDDVLYGVDGAGVLYTIDTVTGTPIFIGNTSQQFSGMAFDPTDGKLWASTGGFSPLEDAIFTIDPTDATATLVGITGLGGATPDIHFDDAGKLFGVKGGGGGANNLISIDKSNGEGMVIGPIGFSAVSGLAFRNTFMGIETNFLSCLDGNQEVPPVMTIARGGGMFTLNAQQDSLTFNIRVCNLSGPIVAAHFHNAAVDVNGPIVREITADFSGEVAVGVWSSTDAEPLTPELVRELLAGNIYVNIHTGANPNGEIRGQLTTGVPIDLFAELDGGQEVPPVSTVANGSGTFTLSGDGSGLEFDIAVSDLSGPITAAHFHNAAVGVIGPVIRTITGDFVGDGVTGTWTDADAEPLTSVLVAELMAGKIYVNVHNDANPDGEIRGQLVKELPIDTVMVTWCDVNLSAPESSRDTVFICIDNITDENVIAYQLQVTFDENVLDAVGATSVGTISETFGPPTVNTTVAGQIIVGGFGSEPLPGSGPIVGLIFDVVGNSGDTSDLCIQSVLFNAGDPLANIPTPCCPFEIGNEFDIAGSVLYCPTGGPVVNTTLILGNGSADTLVSDSNGNYLFENLQGGLNYMVTPSKADDIGLFSISCFDAALIAQHAVGLISLPPCSLKAADVDEDGNIFTFDAALTCRFAVGLPPFGPNDHTGEWLFEPENRTYEPLESDQQDQNYLATLLGDVDGNWTPASSESILAKGQAQHITFVDEPKWTREGKEITTSLYFNGGSSAVAFELDFLFESDAIEFVSADSPIQGWNVIENDTEAGRLRLGMYSTNPINEPSEFVHIKWKVIKRKESTNITLNRALVNQEAQAVVNFEVALESPLPTEFVLDQNYPNPFNPETTIHYAIPSGVSNKVHVTLRIYNMLGQLVRTLVDEEKSSGRYKVVWDGRHDSGARVSSGLFFYTMTAGDFKMTNKMLILK